MGTLLTLAHIQVHRKCSLVVFRSRGQHLGVYVSPLQALPLYSFGFELAVVKAAALKTPQSPWMLLIAPCTCARLRKKGEQSNHEDAI